MQFNMTQKPTKDICRSCARMEKEQKIMIKDKKKGAVKAL